MQIRFWEALHQRFLQPSRAALGEERAAAAERAGREMTFEETVENASALASTFA